MLQYLCIIYFVYSTYIKLFEKVKAKRSIFRQSVTLIIETIDQVKEVIVHVKALKAFGISHQQYYAWKRNQKCKVSPTNLCRKVYHNQLTTKEVDMKAPLN